MTSNHIEITKLREQVAAQAAVIEKSASILSMISKEIPKTMGKVNLVLLKEDIDSALETLATPTDSTQILDEVRRAEREKCAKVCETAEIPIDIEVWCGTKKALTAATAIGLASRIRAME